MKSYNEVAQTVLARRDEYMEERKIRNKKITQIAATAGSFCLVAVLGVGIFHLDNMSKPPAVLPENTTEAGAVITQVETTENEPTSPAPPGSYNSKPSQHLMADPTKMNPIEESPRRVWGMNINAVTNKVTGAPRYYDPKLYHKETRNSAEYFGRDFTSIGLGFKSVYNKDVTLTVKNDTGEIVQDAKRFVLEKGDTASVDIYVSRLYYPSNTVYQHKTKVKTAFKAPNGSEVEAIIYQEIPSSIYADFNCNGFKFHIYTGCRSTDEFDLEKEFAEIIKSVIKIACE